ncbi:aldehyde dehydrogenase family protein [Xanthovirga aplysinae]|uniref:aldehyde dehydrogenase family protein n=1 Tax=Xanthovirga aplysinae TaxID=2529853 RepID=UPI0012BD82AD|nr:aldehyde dehydrogenase family protein [Xanthovirga aplysinae]MTI30019.1 aldehyde dehydrogenase family protein [Xanthovirga aplysinae]
MDNSVKDKTQVQIKNESVSDIDRVFQIQKSKMYHPPSFSLKERKDRLKRLHQAVLHYQKDIQEALYLDFQKNPGETDLSEILAITSEIKHSLRHLKKWMKPKRVSTPLSLFGSVSHIRQEPKGVVLIISPWNFPFNLTFGPLVSALAGGNRVILKPSEMTPHSSSLIKRIVKNTFTEEEVAVFEGDHTVAQALLEKPFDHIFFTGSPQVGKIVMGAAAKNLSSVTLELGGKSPVIIDHSADIKEAAQKICWGKFINNGQTCIAPDYILVHESKKEEFIENMRIFIEKAYGEETDIISSNDYARIVNQNHFTRINHLLEEAIEKGAKVRFGGITKSSERFISPTLLDNVDLNSKVMQEEIFGPVLPIISYSDLEEALHLIQKKEKPLALYVYSKNRRNIRDILQNTSAGGSCVNDNVLHFFQLNLPFGGVNNSGIGKAHGFHGFQAFSNERGVLRQPTKFSAAKLMFPPYTKTVRKLIELTIKWL